MPMQESGNMELIEGQPVAEEAKMYTLPDTPELDRFFNGMLQAKYAMTLDEMLAKAEIARKFDARPLSQLTMEQRMYLFGGRARITCAKCKRRFFEPILQPWVQRPDGKIVLCKPVTVHGCSICTPAKPQPQEGDTFHRERRKARGKFITVGRGDRGHRDQLSFDGGSIKVAGTRDMMDETLTRDSQASWAFQEQSRQNMESQSRELLLSPTNINAAQKLLREKTVREIQRDTKLTFYTARAGSIGISRLAESADLQTTDSEPEQAEESPETVDQYP
jgi:hypothetical protein